MLTDWLMVIITAIYVAATIFICIYNGKSAKAAKEQTEEMIKQFNSVNRPIVTVRFDIIRSGLLCFVIENEGPISAENVRIKINKEFINNINNQGDRSRLEELNDAIFYLASKQKITVLLGGQPSFSQIAKVKAKFDISYNFFNEHTEIDINQYRFLIVYQSSLEDISQHLKHIKEDDKRFHRDMLKAMDKAPKIQNVVVHNETKSDADKFKIFKEICISPNSTALQISEKLDMEKDYVMELLVELNRIDRLVAYTFYEVTDDEEKALWYRRS